MRVTPARPKELMHRAESAMIAGVGIGLRKPHYEALLATDTPPPWLEFVPENFLGMGGFRAHYLDAMRERYALVPHGVALSIGGPDPLDREYLRALRELARRVSAPYVSDHLCFSRGRGFESFDLLPLPFRDDAVGWVAARAREVMDFLELPLVLENITHYATMPGSTMSEGAFVSAVLAESGAGLLLDVNNAYLNAKNHGRAPLEVLGELPLERTIQIHVAGHLKDGEILLDHHGQPVAAEVLDLYEWVIERVGPVPTLLERDNAIPPLDEVVAEARAVGERMERGLERWAARRAAERREEVEP